MSDLNPCPLCHCTGDSEAFWETITLGSHGGGKFPHCSVECHRCGLSVVVFWKTENGRAVEAPLPKELLQPALDEAKRRWNHIPKAPVPYKLE